MRDCSTRSCITSLTLASSLPTLRNLRVNCHSEPPFCIPHWLIFDGIGGFECTFLGVGLCSEQSRARPSRRANVTIPSSTETTYQTGIPRLIPAPRTTSSTGQHKPWSLEMSIERYGRLSCRTSAHPRRPLSFTSNSSDVSTRRCFAKRTSLFRSSPSQHRVPCQPPKVLNSSRLFHRRYDQTMFAHLKRWTDAISLQGSGREASE